MGRSLAPNGSRVLIEKRRKPLKQSIVNEEGKRRCRVFGQQPRESNKAFAAFGLYLSLGPDRSTAAVAAKLARSEQLIRRRSANYGWTERVAAYGAHLAIVEGEAIEAAAQSKAAEWVSRDHATPASMDRVHGWAEVMQGFGEVAAPLGNGSSDGGIPPKLFIHERCRRLIETLPALQHDPHRPEDVLKVDADEDGVARRIACGIWWRRRRGQFRRGN